MSTSMPTAFWWKEPPDGQDHQPKSLVPGAAGVPGRRLLGGAAADDGGELFDAGHFWEQPVLLERGRLVQGAARPLDRSRRPLPRFARAQPVLLDDDPRHLNSARHSRR